MNKLFLYLLLATWSMNSFSAQWTKQTHNSIIPSSTHYVLAGDISTPTSKIGLFQVIDQKPKLIIEYSTPTKEIIDFSKHINASCDPLNFQ